MVATACGSGQHRLRSDCRRADRAPGRECRL